MPANNLPSAIANDQFSREVHEKIGRGEEVDFQSSLFKKWVQSGSSNIFPNFLEIFISETLFSDRSVAREAKLITKACFFPIDIKDFEKNSLPDDSKQFYCLVPAGTYLKSIHRFAVWLLKEVRRMKLENISQIHYQNKIQIFQCNSELTNRKAIETFSKELEGEVFFINPSEGKGESYKLVLDQVSETLSYAEKNVFVFNTEKMGLQDYAINPNHLIFPCAGLKPLSILRSFSQNKSVKKCTFLEKNPRAIDYYKKFLNSRDSEQIFELQYQTLLNQNFLPKDGVVYLKELTKNALEEGFSGRPEELLKFIRLMNDNSSFIQLDYLCEQDRIISYLDPTETCLFWHSNAWESHYSLYFQSQEELRNNYLGFAKKLSNFYQKRVWVHKNAYEIVVGNEFENPVAVCTAGGKKTGKPKKDSFILLENL
jgi:hypothetical protein